VRQMCIRCVFKGHATFDDTAICCNVFLDSYKVEEKSSECCVCSLDTCLKAGGGLRQFDPQTHPRGTGQPFCVTVFLGVQFVNSGLLLRRHF